MSDIPESDGEEGLPHPREAMAVAGHEKAEAAFLDACNRGRLAHAWLICGPKGVGKASLAYRFARHVLKHGADGTAHESLDLDTDDPVFRQVASQAHPDLLVLRRPWDDKAKRHKTVIPVEEMRRIQGFFGRHAGAGGWRVVLVDSADEMNANAANALLKLLEEPPQKALLLLISHAPARLLPTIRSRCRKLVLNPLSPEALAAVFERHGHALPQGEDLLLLHRLARGSAGRALSLASGGGLDLFRELLAVLDTLPELDGRALHRFSEAMGARGQDQRFAAAADLMGQWLEALIRFKAADREAQALPAPWAETLARAAPLASLDQWLGTWEKVTAAFREADTLNLDRKQTFLSAFFHIERAGEAA